MTRMSVSLSDELKALADARAAESGCASTEEYVEQLIRRDPWGEEFDGELEQLLLERLGGPWVDVDAVDFAQMREKFRRVRVFLSLVGVAVAAAVARWMVYASRVSPRVGVVGLAAWGVSAVCFGCWSGRV